MKPVFLGLDIGGTRIKAVALDGSFDGVAPLEPFEGPSGAQTGPEAVRAAVVETVSHFRRKDLDVVRVGVGCAGSIEPRTGVVRNSPNFAHWKDVPLKTWIETDTGVPSLVENDANCAAYGEWKAGNARGVLNAVLLTLGTGIGGGLILNGELYRGSTGTGGELGHFSIHADGVECPCGNRGCFERYCSASALRLRSGGHSAREIFTNSSDPKFSGLVDGFLKDFAIGLTSLANIFDPDLIVISGGVAKGVSEYFPQLKRHLETHAFPAVGAHVRLTTAKFQNLSGAVGAALLASTGRHSSD